MESIKQLYKTIKRKIDTPPAYLTNEARYHRVKLASTRREIIIVKGITWLFLIASIHQVAWIFSRGEPTLFNYLKAIGIDGAIFFLSQAIAKRALEVFTAPKKATVGRPRKDAPAAVSAQSMADRDSRRATLFLWIGVSVFMVLTTVMNTLYEFWDTGAGTGVIAYNGSGGFLVILTKVLSSSFLAPVVIFMTFVASLLERQMVTGFYALKIAEAEEAKKADERRAAREYREAVKRGERVVKKRESAKAAKGPGRPRKAAQPKQTTKAKQAAKAAQSKQTTKAVA